VTHDQMSITVVQMMHKPGANVVLLDDGRWLGFSFLLDARPFVGRLGLGRLGGRSIQLGLREEEELSVVT
jgi:hypothetical protein